MRSHKRNSAREFLDSLRDENKEDWEIFRDNMKRQYGHPEIDRYALSLMCDKEYSFGSAFKKAKEAIGRIAREVNEKYPMPDFESSLEELNNWSEKWDNDYYKKLYDFLSEN